MKKVKIFEVREVDFLHENSEEEKNYMIEKKVKFMDSHTRTLHYIPNELLERLNSVCRQKGDKTEHMTRALTEYLGKIDGK